MQRTSRLTKQVAIFLVALLLYGCAADRFPQDYYAPKNTGDRICLALRLGMTMDEIRAVVSSSEQKDYVKEGPVDSVLSEGEILAFQTYARYPKDVLKDLKVGTQYRTYRYWVTAHTNVALFLFFDEIGKLRGWVNYPSQFNYEKYWHERLTSKVRVRTEKAGMTRGEIYAMLGAPSETVDLPAKPSRTQSEDHIWLSYIYMDRAPVRGIVKKLDVYVYQLDGGGVRHVYLGYIEFPRFTYRFDSNSSGRIQVPNPKYVGPQQDELVIWGYDQAWEEGERYMRTEVSRSN